MQGKINKESNNHTSDLLLIKEAVQGSQASLEKIILRYQDWIYNIAFKMVMDHDDAADITQEILTKAISSLSSYNPEKAAFSTWIYRITVNHVLNMQKKKFEYRINDIETYVSLIEKLPDERYFRHPERELLTEEIKIGCMMGMMICLKRNERIIFILGGIFGISDDDGSEIMEITKVNFRKNLSRARKKIYSNIKDLCGLVDSENPCRCSNKVASFLDFGMADPENLRFNHTSRPKVRDVIKEKYEAFKDQYYEPFFELYRQHPFYEPQDTVQRLRDIMQNNDFRKLFNL